uniref:BZIP domain-containing protein n=1 Tax=Kalanchoe fedtschenkoi TaxID=63787 RepID=A0A7N0V4Q5_KALFE
MATSSGNSISTAQIQHSAGSEEVGVMDQRKRKRMQSNRESARRSRMRKQKHLDDLTAQVNQIRKENHQIMTSIGVTNQQYLNVEAESCILRAQMCELKQRLQSLNQIIHCINTTPPPPQPLAPASTIATSFDIGVFDYGFGDDDDFLQTGFINPWNNMGYINQQPIMASADMFQH